MTRQYNAVRRSRQICSLFFALLMFASKIGITDFSFGDGQVRARLLPRTAECKPGQGMYVE